MPNRRAVSLAGKQLDAESRHVCAFFHTPEEYYRVLLPFIRAGLQSGEKGFHIVDPALRQDHFHRLREHGINADNAEAAGQLEVRVWEQAHLRGGRFSQDAMLNLIQEALSRGQAEGYPRTRFIASMEWALEDAPGVHDIVEYESRLNYVLPRFHDPVICTYDLARFGGHTVMDVLRTHPLAIVGGILQENPFYVHPDEFLSELRSRRDAAA